MFANLTCQALYQPPFQNRLARQITNSRRAARRHHLTRRWGKTTKKVWNRDAKGAKVGMANISRSAINEANAGQARRHHIGRRTDMTAVVVRHPAGIPLPRDLRDEQLHAKAQGKGCRRSRSRVRSHSRTKTSLVSHRPLYDDQSNDVLGIVAETGSQWHLALSGISRSSTLTYASHVSHGPLTKRHTIRSKIHPGETRRERPFRRADQLGAGIAALLRASGGRMTSRGLRGIALERL